MLKRDQVAHDVSRCSGFGFVDVLEQTLMIQDLCLSNCRNRKILRVYWDLFRSSECTEVLPAHSWLAPAASGGVLLVGRNTPASLSEPHLNTSTSSNHTTQIHDAGILINTVVLLILTDEEQRWLHRR
jgi:hypothetical protein